ncbi:MAG: type I restriction enzyme S subunit, partial [Urechidicola sp.]
LENGFKGAGLKHISKGYISDIKIPLPPLDQQKKIAAILDAADAYRQKTKALITKYDALTQSLFLDMFGDPLRNPKGWEIVTIRDIITEAKYGTSSKADENGIYSYLRMNNITYKGHMDYSNLKYINVPDDQIHKYETKKGDILFNRTNSKELVGKTGIIATDDKMILAGYLIRLRMKEAYNPYFLWSHLNSKWAKITLKNMCKSIVGMANINAQELQNIKVVDPPMDLQNQFAERVQAIEAQKAQAQASLAQAEDLFNSLLQRAFKGELV